MARDHALAAALGADEAILRIYRWDRPTISLGRNEPARGCYDLAAAARAGFAFVRRPTGGRAVLHDRELTYAVVLPARALGGPRRAYAVINSALARGLRGLGVPAELAGAAPSSLLHHDARGVLVRTAPLSAGPCFQLPAAGEVTVDGRKLVGSAQVRIGNALLQHGSVLMGPGQERLQTLRIGGPTGAPRREPVSLEELVEPVPHWDDLVNAVARGLREELDGVWEDRKPPGLGSERQAALRDRYASEAWTWRR
jgi:lipoate-protein ligase A